MSLRLRVEASEGSTPPPEGEGRVSLVEQPVAKGGLEAPLLVGVSSAI
jgi:hypothetical protein